MTIEIEAWEEAGQDRFVLIDRFSDSIDVQFFYDASEKAYAALDFVVATPSDGKWNVMLGTSENSNMSTVLTCWLSSTNNQISNRDITDLSQHNSLHKVLRTIASAMCVKSKRQENYKRRFQTKKQLAK